MNNPNICWPGWETVRLIGRGGFGAVYEIQRELVNETVEKAALKVITIPQNDSDIEEMRSDGYDDESITATYQSHLRSIVDEYSTMRKMNGSANIVNCDDVHYEAHVDGIGWDVYIKMELLTPLVKCLPDSIPEEMVVKLAKDLCAALELCRRYDVIHRDIKPQNIFLSDNGDYKLGDFGIAKTVEKTMGGTKIGTYKYMAPEVYNNQPYGASADLYSLGLVLYWMLNDRRLPFMPQGVPTMGADEEARARRFSGEPIPAPRNGSEELKQIVLKACAFDPKDRFESAQEMLSALKNMGWAEQAISKVEVQEVQVHEELELDKTSGPAFGQEPVADYTAGPVWNDREENREDHTAGPVFDAPQSENNSRKTEPKKNLLVKLGIIIGAVLALVIVLLVWRPFGGKEKPIEDQHSQVDSQGTEAGTVIADANRIMAGKTTGVAYVAGEYTYRSDDALIWTSSNPEVAQVSDDGTVTGVSAGTATITGSLNGSEASVTIYVEAEIQPTEAGMKIESIQVNLRTSQLLLGDTIDAWLSTESWHLQGDTDGIRWSVDDPSIASVDDSGRVTALKSGTCQVIAIYQGATASQKLTVVNVDTSSGAVVQADYQKLSMRQGSSDTVQITFSGNMPELFGAMVYPSAGLQMSLEWGELKVDSLPLEIQMLYGTESEGYATILVYDQNDPGHIVAATKIQFRIN